MKVWIAFAGEYEDRGIVSVHLTEAAAVAASLAERGPMIERQNDRARKTGNWQAPITPDVEEHEVQE